MPRDFLYIYNESGERERVSYDELDKEIYPQLWRPIGGFCYPADNFLRVKLPEVPFYIKDWLPKQGKMMLYAPPKTGKSFVAIQMARCIASEEHFLGMPTSQGRVLYIQSELGERVLQDRIRSTGQDYENVYVGTTFAMKLDTHAGQGYLLQALLDVVPDVLIIDPWYKVLQGDENESKDARAITDFLDGVIESCKCSVVIIHHPGKDISRGGRGSSVLEDWVDSYIEMKKLSKNSEPLRIKITPKLLRHASLPPEPIEAEMVDFEFQTAAPKVTVKDLVGEYIASAQHLVTPKELGGFGSHKAIYNALEQLMEEELVEKVGRGEYQWNGGDNAPPVPLD